MAFKSSQSDIMVEMEQAFKASAHNDGDIAVFNLQGALVSGGSLGGFRQIDESTIFIGTYPDDVALKAINTTDPLLFPSMVTRVYAEGLGEYFLDRDSVAAESLPDVVQPTVGIGRWIKVSGRGFGPNLRNLLKLIDSSSSLLEDITHADLLIAIGASTLTEGKFYRMAYQTIHQMPETSVVMTGPTEYLIFQATATNDISKIVFSQGTRDLIIYDYSSILAEDGLTARPGIIERRIDYLNNIDTHFDFKGSYIRCYSVDVASLPTFIGSNPYTAGTVIYNSNAIYGCIKAYTSSGSFAVDYASGNNWVMIMFDVDNIKPFTYPITPIPVAGFNVPVDLADFSDELTIDADCRNIILEHDKDSLYFYPLVKIGEGCEGIHVVDKTTYGYIGPGSYDIKVGKESFNFFIGESCRRIDLQAASNTFITKSVVNVTIKAGTAFVNGNLISDSCKDIHITESTNNVIGKGCFDVSIFNTSSNKLGHICSAIEIKFGSSNYFGTSTTKCSLINTSTSNINGSLNILKDSSNITFGTGCQNNKITLVTTATFGTSCIGNVFNGNGSHNIAASCIYNEIYNAGVVTLQSSAAFNIILGASSQNIGVGCARNKISNSANVQLGASCVDNTIKTSGNSTFGSSCINNDLDDSADMTFGSNCNHNKITSAGMSSAFGSGSSNNEMLSCSFIDLGTNCTYNKIANVLFATLPANSSYNILNEINSITFTGVSSHNRIFKADFITASGPTNNCEYDNCSTVDTTTATSCVFKYQSNKTYSAALSGVVILIHDDNTKTYTNSYTDIVVDKRSPDNNLWFDVINNLGAITPAKLT